jgi:1,4-dihydroxy-2-naphthoate octaprenyltransferase
VSATVAFSGVRPGSARAWVIAARPPTLTAAVVPVLVGTACAVSENGVRVGPALAALTGALLLQIAANFANDVFDYEKGADTAERLGPVRAVQAGLLTPGAVRRGLYVVLGLALLIGVYLTAVAGFAVVAIGLASMAAAVAYTGGPYPLGYHGLGDVFVMLFFGFVAVLGTTFVELGRVTTLAVLASVPVGALATAILVVNNLRDIATDRVAGKGTLAVRWGERGALTEYALLLVVAYAVPVALVLTHHADPSVLLPLLTLPLALRLFLRVRSERGRALNPLLAGTAKLLLLYGVLFSVGLVVGSCPKLR